MIKHICFDFTGTLMRFTETYKKAYKELAYKTYARVIRKPLTKKLMKDFGLLPVPRPSFPRIVKIHLTLLFAKIYEDAAIVLDV